VSKITVHLTGDEAKLVRALDKVVQKERELARSAEQTGVSSERASKRAARGTEEWDGASKKLMGTATQLLGAFGVGIGIGAGVAKIVQLSKEWLENMEAIARSSREAGREVTALAMMQQAGEAGAAAREAVTVGMQYGMGPGESFSALQQLQSQLGSRARGLEAMGWAGRLAQWGGVSPAAAPRAVSLGTALGLSPMEAAQAPYAAGELSSLSPEELVQMASKGLPGWEGKTGAFMGYAVGAQLSQVIKEPGRLGTSVQSARLAVMGAGQKDLWQKLRVADAGFVERLRALDKAGLTTDLALQEAGFGEIRQRFAVGLLLRDIPGLEEKFGEISAMAGRPGLLGGKRAAAEAELPQMEHQRGMEFLDAAYAAERGFPSTVPAAQRARRAENRAELWAIRRLAVQRAGYGDLLGEEGTLSYFNWWRARTLRGWVAPEGALGPVYREDPSPLDLALGQVRRELGDVREAPQAELADAVEEGVRRGSRPTALAHPDEDR